MSLTIFRFELRYALTRPVFWFYAAFFLGVPLFVIAMRAGIFGDEPEADTLINSPWDMYESSLFFQQLLLLALPGIIGLSLFRDFKSKTHQVLFSYPIRKRNYTWSKFSSSLLPMILIGFLIGFGAFFGVKLPGVNPVSFTEWSWFDFSRLYALILIPNILIFSFFVFGVVLLTRNLYTGFAVVVGRYLFNGLLVSLFAHADGFWFLAILEPTGEQAMAWATQYWSADDYLYRSLPIDLPLILNRLFWLLSSVSFFAFAMYRFQLSVDTLPFSLRRWIPGSAKLNTKNSEPTYSYRSKELSPISINPNYWTLAKASWHLSNIELLYVLKSKLFQGLLAAGILMVLFQQAEMNPAFGFKILPVTWKLLNIPTLVFSAVILMMTYLFAGMLVQRARLANMDQLIDSSMAPNGLLMASKFLALIKMQALLLSVILFAGLAIQAIEGFGEIRLGLYLFDLYGLKIWTFVIWGMASFLVQAVFRNVYLGFFLLFLGSMGIAGLSDFGIDHLVFRFSYAPRLEYSDLGGYGSTLGPFLLFKSYWLWFAAFLTIPTYLVWYRGFPDGIKHRFKIAFQRLTKPVLITSIFFLSTFVGWGTWIYTTDKKADGKLVEQADWDRLRADFEKQYKRYETLPIPKITAADLNMNFFPDEKAFSVQGNYTLTNKTNHQIDTILFHYSYDEQTSYHFEGAIKAVSIDTAVCTDVWKLSNPMMPGDELVVYFEVKSIPQTLFIQTSGVRSDGTFLRNSMLPGIGYRDWEHRSATKRKEFGLAPRSEWEPDPLDSLSQTRSYQSADADLLDLKTIVSAPLGHEAIGPGKLIKSWESEGRSYNQFQVETPIKKFFGFNTGVYAKRIDNWEGVDLEIYHHPSHDYNLDRMMSALKASLDYCTEAYSPYPHAQIRVIEIPIHTRFAATTFANTIVTSEALFLADIDDEDHQVIDLPFYVTAHEMAHQWWGNQLIPANAAGSKMLTESLAEYTALKILEKEYGKEKVRKFLEYNHEVYLSERKKATKREHALHRCQSREKHIHYRKGALVLYHLSEQIGETQFNKWLSEFMLSFSAAEAPYPTSDDLIQFLEDRAPETLSTYFEDSFRNITLFDHELMEVNQEKQGDSITMTVYFETQKFRIDSLGTRIYETPSGGSQKESQKTEIKSLPLNEWIKIGIYRKGEKIHEEERNVKQTKNQWKIKLAQKGDQIILDPYFSRMDVNPRNNTLRISP